MRRIALDPGVLISAFISPRQAAPGLIVRALFDGRIEAVACPMLLDELTDVLARKKFAKHAREGRADAYIAAIETAVTLVPDPPQTGAHTAGPNDDYLLWLAQAHHLDAVVSGDRHLLDADSPQLPVLSPRQLLDSIDEAHRGMGEEG